MPFEPALAFGDLEGDGDEDMMVGTSKGGVVYYRNDGGTSVGGGPPTPPGFRLDQNYPNPFNASTVITVELPSAATLRVDVFDLQGRVVDRLALGRRGAGSHRLTWNAEGRPSGVYFCRVSAGGRVGSITMLLIR